MGLSRRTSRAGNQRAEGRQTPSAKPAASLRGYNLAISAHAQGLLI